MMTHYWRIKKWATCRCIAIRRYRVVEITRSRWSLELMNATTRSELSVRLRTKLKETQK